MEERRPKPKGWGPSVGHFVGGLHSEAASLWKVPPSCRLSLFLLSCVCPNAPRLRALFPPRLPPRTPRASEAPSCPRARWLSFGSLRRSVLAVLAGSLHISGAEAEVGVLAPSVFVGCSLLPCSQSGWCDPHPRTRLPLPGRTLSGVYRSASLSERTLLLVNS